MNNEYTSLKELYLSLLPAFDVKKRLIDYEKLNITNKDIWQYLQETKWKMQEGLSLSDMTSDIINVELDKIISYREG